eukprot:CAMPEP_0198336414 /NCGR_PEP_ID=MMETSP1450-20131203/20984_1 /TAXON_ID=753684 ORGANISM="Madagascaria erythrocladiodes, Strain CCMP3234" /NCGR_SAMPLE_ID=MMETSP1450 /ASSEMBLY_ACC=CAM_ASM_001115 /LENGTH=168 /DNA_ID=CAMNT_0044041153 /DNA_START=1 /DNA_END=507 /DNA_ORIENTATION=+
MDLLRGMEGEGCGLESGEEETEEVAECVAAVEGQARGRAPARSPLLVGTWDLAYTNSKAVRRNKGVTGVGALLPFAKLVGIRQVLEEDGSAKTVEILSVAGRPVTNVLSGKFAARNDTVFEQTYESADLGPFRSLKNTSKAVLAVTFLRGALRICRNQRGELFVFRKT